LDYANHRKRMLRHCLWMANSDQDYAKWAARRYEQESNGVLEGLHARVVQTIDQQISELENQPTGEK